MISVYLLLDLIITSHDIPYFSHMRERTISLLSYSIKADFFLRVLLIRRKKPPKIVTSLIMPTDIC